MKIPTETREQLRALLEEQMMTSIKMGEAYQATMTTRPWELTERAGIILTALIALAALMDSELDAATLIENLASADHLSSELAFELAESCVENGYSELSLVLDASEQAISIYMAHGLISLSATYPVEMKHALLSAITFVARRLREESR